jgi:hypothetical protein
MLDTMKSWSWHRTRVVLLAILLGLGMSLSFIQGSVIAAEMAVAADGTHPGPNGCNCCDGGDHKNIDAGLPDVVRVCRSGDAPY